jgi:hypothetical protein
MLAKFDCLIRVNQQELKPDSITNVITSKRQDLTPFFLPKDKRTGDYYLWNARRGGDKDKVEPK